MFIAVESVAVFEFVIVARELQRFCQCQICLRPVAVGVVQIVLAVLHENPDRFLGSLANQRRVIVAAFASCRSVSDVREAADPRQNFAELCGTLPCNSPRTDAAAADTADGSAGRVMTQLCRLLDFGKNLFQQKPRVPV